MVLKTKFFRAIVESKSRSRVNVVFRLPTEELEKKFVSEADEQGYMHVKGHRYKVTILVESPFIPILFLHIFQLQS